MIMRNDCKHKSIAFVIGNMQRDGAERVISILADYYSGKGWKVDILTLLSNRCDYELNPQVNIFPICRERKSYYSNIIFWIKGIRKYIKSQNPEKIVAFFARINILTLIASINLKKRIIISERNDPRSDGRNGFVKLATYVLYRLADSIVFQTKWAQSCFPSSIKNKSCIIANPTKVYSSRSKVTKGKIVAVGRLEPQKNHFMLLDAFTMIQEKYREYELYIYGDGSLKNVIEQKISDLAISDSVYLPGNVANIHERIVDAEMFVLPSNYEGLSNALLEALMLGIPSISTDCAGSNEVIIDGINGLLIPIGDRDKLFKAIERLINNPGLAKKIGENAKNYSIHFASDTVIKQWESIIGN